MWKKQINRFTILTLLWIWLNHRVICWEYKLIIFERCNREQDLFCFLWCFGGKIKDKENTFSTTDFHRLSDGDKAWLLNIQQMVIHSDSTWFMPMTLKKQVLNWAWCISWILTKMPHSPTCLRSSLSNIQIHFLSHNSPFLSDTFPWQSNTVV